MTVWNQWRLTFITGSAQEAVVVEYSGATGPRGHPVYIDAQGHLRAEITSGGFVYPLSGAGLPRSGTPIHAHPLVQQPA